jgi:3-hydroxyisobutyrate dehydrogenase-like beta-hydroxyacid dehydrogenase
MGAALGAALIDPGREVRWVSAGRSEATARRAEASGLRDAGRLGALVGECEAILSVCPPHAAPAVAESVAREGFSGLYVEANAIAPRTSLALAARVRRAGATYVDGAIIGPPPGAGRSPRLYLSGGHAGEAAELFAGTSIDARRLGGDPYAASALKAAFAAWTKAGSALLLAAEAAARRAGVGEELAAEWSAMPGVGDRLRAARRDAAAKGWRWVGEMEEGARAFADLGQPSGFHAAAGEVYRG